MKWNTKKSVILRSKETQEHKFVLSGIRLRIGREVKYLAVTITDEGISDSKLVDRIKKSKKCAREYFRRLGRLHETVCIQQDPYASTNPSCNQDGNTACT